MAIPTGVHLDVGATAKALAADRAAGRIASDSDAAPWSTWAAMWRWPGRSDRRMDRRDRPESTPGSIGPTRW